MKCSNCGFETDTSFCPMCGGKIENTGSEKITENSNTVFQNDLNPQTGFDGTDGKAETNPYAPQPAYNPALNQYQQPPVQTQYPNSPQYGSQNMPKSDYPTPPAFVPPVQENPSKKGNGKAAAIILGCIVGAVIIAGAVIMSFSAAAGISINDNGGGTTTIGGSSYYNGSYITDENEYTIGDEVSTKFGSMTLKSIEPAAVKNSKDYPDCDFYKITFDVTNKLKEELIVSTYDFTTAADSDDSYDAVEEVYDFNNATTFYLWQDETSEVYIVYAVPKDALSLDIQYDYYNYDINDNDYLYNFRIEDLDRFATADEAAAQ